MSVSFTLTANNTQELVSNLKLCLALLEPSPAAPAAAPATVVADGPEPQTKGKGGRKKQAESPAPVQTDIEEVTSAPAPEPTPTYDDATAALRDLNAKHGMQSVRVLLGEFGYEKVNQMKPENYGAIIEKAKAQTAA